MKYLCGLIVCCCFALAANAQFKTVFIGVNGLTCSQCSRTVEMSIRKLDFVADVKMNLEHTEGSIILKKDKKADMEKVAQAVINAGFSVRYLTAEFNVDKSVTSTGGCFDYKGDEYIFTAPLKGQMEEEIYLTFIGKKFQPKSEYKKYEQYEFAKCGTAPGKIYHVKDDTITPSKERQQRL